MPRYDKLLVLDLDETLVHACEEPLDRPAEHRILDLHVYRRPHVDAFLHAVLERFDVGVWTASRPDYAAAVVSALVDPARLRFLYARDRCTHHADLETWERTWLKDIRKLRRFGFPRAKILVVDDSPEKLRRSYGNLVRVAPYEGRADDGELPILLRYLDELGPAEDVRRIEKRWWRGRFSRS